MTQETAELVDFQPIADGAASTNGGKSSTPSLDDRIAPRRRRWPWLVVGAAVGCGATLLATTVGNDEAGADPLPQEAVQLSTVTVQTRDLIEEVEWSGMLAAGLAVVVNATNSGVVTDAAETGEAIERGDVLAVVGNEPVVALYGSLPMWRDLGEGDVGADVRQLEANLVQLGFDPDRTVTIDDEYTSATADMVEAWEQTLGLEATGRVARSGVVVLGGPSTISEPAVVGSTVRADSQLAVVDTLVQRIDVIGWQYDPDEDAPGVVSSIAAVGTPIEHGAVLYSVDGFDVSAVVTTDSATDAVLAAFASSDVEQIENVLVFIGFDPERSITIDDEIDLATVAAVQRWQESAGLLATGSTNPRDYVLILEAADMPYVVDTHSVSTGDLLGEGRVVLSIGAPTLSVTADVAISEIDEFAVGDTVRVVQLDESEFTAAVVDIADVASDVTIGQDAEPTVAVTFDVTSEPEEYVSGSVTIVTESSRIENAVVVPTRALVTLREGGFAVEVQDTDGSTRLVGVEIGVFDDGSVEITNGALAPGDEVVVPT